MPSDQVPGIHIVAVAGSVRAGSFTVKALDAVVGELKHRGVSTENIDLRATHLPFPGMEGNPQEISAVREKVRNATGIVLATPEYHGSFSSVMKLFIENLGFPSALSGKPVALLGVASGQIGAVKAIEHLRGVCSHVGALVLPGSVSIAGINKVFDSGGRFVDPVIEKRVKSVAASLVDYISKHICPLLTIEQMARQREAV
jgi:chromate reductase, NAD(P)H dehydrogenase (quinone)